MRKIRLVWILCAIAMLVIAACGPVDDEPDVPDDPAVDDPVDDEETKMGGNLRFGWEADLHGTDPHAHSAFATHHVFRMIYEPLVTISEDFEVIPALATHWDMSADGRSFTFYIQEDKVFHNGDPVTAEDIAYSVNRMRDKDISPRPAEFAMIKDVQAIDEFTVEVELHEPTPVFLSNISQLNLTHIVPKEHTEAQMEQYGEIREPIGTGPFKFVEWVEGTQTVLERFDDYVPFADDREPTGLGGVKTVYVDQLTFIPIPDEGTRLAALQAGDVDIATHIPPREVDGLKQQPGITVEAQTSGSVAQLFFAHNPPFDDIRMRQAVALGVDWDEVNELTNWGYGLRNHSFLPTFTAWHTGAHKDMFEYDPDRARELMAEAGYDGEKLSINATEAYAYMHRSAVAIQEQLTQLGMNVEINSMDWSTKLAAYESAEYDMTTYGLSMRFDPDLYYYARVHSSAPAIRYSNPEYDAIVEEARDTMDFDKRVELYEQAQRILMEDVAVINMFNTPFIMAYGDHVQGFIPWGAGAHRFWNVWLDN